ncbi:copper chaperone PCu(A)C [Streptomyces sp. S1A1-8]|uniref:copper chaperone PCu(A)C n=1 Tax=Streptomyces TaxID=1883 RepID=UPI0011626388|nr:MULTISPECIES: copper chaperone PCu(A)C [unclassified Streptomyces]QDO20923.1 copper chaperone PCu(A)C [Streptomyces sp. S1A1-8]QDO31049.1 copper chaperone PCu(A)C [Streptomyces sp. S1A1-3]
MSSSLRRGALAAAAIAFSIASLAACGAGNNAQTLEVKPDNAATSVGDIKIQNALVITQPDTTSTGPAVVSATVFNNGRTPQTLDSVKIGGDGVAQITPAKGGGKLTIPAGGHVILGGEGNASAALSNPGAAVKDGNAQPITFTFSKTGDVKLRAFVVPAESYFTKWGPTNIPAAPGATATGSATSSKSPKTSKSPKASTSPSDSVSGLPTDAASASATATGTATATASSSAGH